MQIVIDIPKEDYEYLKAHNKHGLYSSILNGTVLLKGHGRLIDADKYLEEQRPRGIADDVWKESNIYKTIMAMSTIIEADKENN